MADKALNFDRDFLTGLFRRDGHSFRAKINCEIYPSVGEWIWIMRDGPTVPQECTNDAIVINVPC